jgi:tetratricopeptide (TPR) repeat protein
VKFTSVLAGLAVLVVATVVAAGGLVVLSNDPTAPADTAPATTADPVEFWQRRVDARADDFVSRTQLAGALLARARAEHNTSDAITADAEIDKVLAVVPADRSALLVKADARMFVHDFAGGREYAQRVFDADETDKSALAMLGDAYFELGRLDRAATLYDRLAMRVPTSPEVFARRARLAHARGDEPGALTSAERAIAEAAKQNFTPVASTYYVALLAELQRGAGRYADAAASFQRVLTVDEVNGPAIEGLAKVEAALGNVDASERLWRRSGELIGSPDFHVLSALGDLAHARGDERAASALWSQAIDALALLSSEERVGFLRDESRFRASHALDPGEAVRLAREDLHNRQDALAYDTLAWAQLAAGDTEGARASIEIALRSGVRDAAVGYHAAEIYAAAGDRDRACAAVSQAIALSPAFDVYEAPRAHALAGRCAPKAG